MLVFTACNVVAQNAKVNLNDIGGFKCFGQTKMSTPIRLSASGDVECFSVNGRDCATNFNNDRECRVFIAKNIHRIKTLTCGKQLKSITGKSGYKDKKHWCSQGRKFFFKKWHCKYDTGLDTPIRFNAKTFRPECLSINGKTCIRGHLSNLACNKANNCKIFKKKIRAVSCGNKQLASPGYHWCKKAFAYFRYTGEFQCRSTTKLFTPVRIDQDGYIQCLSKNGKHCKQGQSSDAKCHNTILKLTDGGRRKPRAVSCGNQLKDLTGKTGFEEKCHWCSKAFPILFNRQNIDKILDARVVKHGVRRHRKNRKAHKPKWFKRLGKFFRSKHARTKQGLRKIHSILKRRGIKNRRHRHRIANWIHRHIRTGRKLSRNFFRGVHRRLRRHIPSLRRRRGGRRAFRRMPRWWIRFIRFFRSRRAKSPAGLARIRQVLTKRGFKFTPRRWNRLTRQIKSPKFRGLKHFNRVLRSIRRNIPKLRRSRRTSGPRWWRRIVRFFRSKHARTPRGLRRIRHIFKRRGVKVNRKLWRFIRSGIRGGRVRSPRFFNRFLRKIKNRHPVLRKHIRRTPRSRFFRRLGKFLRSAAARTKRGIRRLRQLFRKRGIRFAPKRWRHIHRAIRSGKIRRPQFFRRVMKQIRRKTPYVRKLGRKAKSWFRRFRRFIRSKRARSPRGIKRLRGMLRKAGFKFTPKRWANIHRAIRSGRIRHPRFFKRIVRHIRRFTPRFSRFVRRPHRRHRGNRRRGWFRKFWRRFTRFFRSKRARTPRGLKRVRAMLRRSGYKFTPKRWRSIRTAIRSGRVRNPVFFKRLAKSIRRNIPRRHRGRGGKRGFRFIKWWRRFTRFIRSKAAKTPKGIQRIRRSLSKVGWKFTPKRWGRIHKSILSGRINKPKFFKRIMKIVRRHSRKLRRGAKRSSVFRIKSWLRKLGRFIRSKHGRTKAGIKKIRHALRTAGFKFGKGRRWKRMVKFIRSGRVKTPRHFRFIMRSIRKFTPKVKRVIRKKSAVRRHPKWWRKFKKFIRSKFSRTPKGLKSIRRFLRKRGHRFSPKKWKSISSRIRTGKFKFRKVFPRLIKKYRIIFKRRLFLHRLRKLLRRKDAHTDAGVRRIKSHLTRRARINPKKWERIEKLLTKKNLSKRDGVHSLFKRIRTVLPKKFKNICKVKLFGKNRKSNRKNKSKKNKGLLQ